MHGSAIFWLLQMYILYVGFAFCLCELLKLCFNNISTSEYILRIQIEFSCVKQVYTQLRNSVFIPLFPQFPHTMMVGNTAPSSDDLIPGLLLDRLVYADGIFQSLVVETEVEINATTAVVSLSHAASDHEVFYVVRLTLLCHAVFHVFAEK